MLFFMQTDSGCAIHRRDLVPRRDPEPGIYEVGKKPIEKVSKGDLQVAIMIETPENSIQVCLQELTPGTLAGIVEYQSLKSLFGEPPRILEVHGRIDVTDLEQFLLPMLLLQSENDPADDFRDHPEQLHLLLQKSDKRTYGIIRNIELFHHKLSMRSVLLLSTSSSLKQGRFFLLPFGYLFHES
jgi:hypothetical protein